MGAGTITLQERGPTNGLGSQHGIDNVGPTGLSTGTRGMQERGQEEKTKSYFAKIKQRGDHQYLHQTRRARRNGTMGAMWGTVTPWFIVMFESRQTIPKLETGSKATKTSTHRAAEK